jgi:hypothetical protein
MERKQDLKSENFMMDANDKDDDGLLTHKLPITNMTLELSDIYETMPIYF